MKARSYYCGKQETGKRNKMKISNKGRKIIIVIPKQESLPATGAFFEED